MPFVKKFELKLYVPENWEVAAHMANLWEKNLGEAGALIKDKLDEKFPDDGTFIRDLVNPSSTGYAPMLNPDFVSRSERTTDNIRSIRQGNMSDSFARWKTNMAKAFAEKDGVPAKDFKARIAAAKDRWALKMGAGLLRFTGDKIRGRSVAPITAFYLVGDMRAIGWMSQGDEAQMPYNIARDSERPSVKAALLNRLVQGGLMIVKAGPEATAEIGRQNDINAKLLSSLRDPLKADIFVAVPAVDTCYCAWETDTEGRLILHTVVGITVP